MFAPFAISWITYLTQVERQIALLLSLLAPRRTVQFFLSARCKRGESRRTRFEILQGLVRQLNGIDFASYLVVLYSCLPTRLPVLCLTRLANMYVYSFSVPTLLLALSSAQVCGKSRGKRKTWETILPGNPRLTNLFFLTLLIRQWYSFNHKFLNLIWRFICK